MGDPCDGHTAACWAAEERAHARQAEEEEQLEREYASAVDAYVQEVGEFHMRIADFLVAWLKFAETLRETGEGQEPVFPSTPIHPDDLPADDREEIPY